jgi:hypothetical protein
LKSPGLPRPIFTLKIGYGVLGTAGEFRLHHRDDL